MTHSQEPDGLKWWSDWENLDLDADADCPELPGWLVAEESTPVSASAIETYEMRAIGRYYCPICGMVRDVGLYNEDKGWYVRPHGIQTGQAWTYDNDCPGGSIDLTKDRAP